jgi:hypothetical protein
MAPSAKGGITAMWRRRLLKPNPPGSVPTMAHDPNEPDEPDSRRGALIGLLITVVLVVAAYYLLTALREKGKLEDCLMSGRSNCAPIDTGPAK